MTSAQNTITLEEIFGHLPAPTRTRLKDILHLRSFETGDKIYLQGAPTRAIYVIARGRVKVARVTKEGYESILCVRGPGESFCPVTVLDKGSQLGTAIAMTDVVLWWAERQAFEALCYESAALLAFVQSDCLLEGRRLLGRVEAFAFRSIRERLAFTLLDESQRQLAHNELRLTQQELAGLVGASRESVSRALSKLADEGVLRVFRGRLVIDQPEQLKRIVEGRDRKSGTAASHD